MTRPGFNILVCPDAALLKQHIDQMLRQMLQQTGDEYEPVTYWGDDELPDKFWQDMSSASLLGGSKAVILRHVEAMPEAMLKQLGPVLAGPTGWPFLCVESAWERGKPKLLKRLTKQKFWQVAKKRQWIWSAPGLDAKSLPNHVKAWARQQAIAIPQPVFRKLYSLLPVDAAALQAELDKLDLALGERRELSMEDLELLAPVFELDFWEMLNALTQGRASIEVWREVLRERSASENLLFPLLASLTRECRLLWQLMHGEDVRLPGWIKDKKQAAARRMGPDKVRTMFGLALEADMGVKTGEKNDAQALESLVAGLCVLFSAPGRPRPNTSGQHFR